MKLSDIHKDCQRKLASAMRETYSDAGSIIDYSFATFYGQGNPKRPRTGTLEGSKKVDPPRISGDTAYLKAGYEGDQISYSDGTFSGAEVLGATMTGTYGVVGDPSYDEEAFRLIIETAKANFTSQFGK